MKAELEKWEELDNDVINNNKTNSNSSKKKLPVAVKMVKKGCDAELQESLIQEVKVMMNIGHHINVLALIGCCTLSGKL